MLPLEYMLNTYIGNHFGVFFSNIFVVYIVKNMFFLLLSILL